MKYISILRGINVSGQKNIKMADLKKMYEDAGFSDVETYIQSGNVVFQTSIKDTEGIKSRIQSGILDTYGFDVPVIILTASDLKQVLENNPFRGEEFNSDKVYFTFLDKEPEKDKVENVMAYSKKGEEELVVSGKVVYFYCPGGYGRTKLNNNFLENKLKVTATTRNTKTSEKLLEMVGNH